MSAPVDATTIYTASRYCLTLTAQAPSPRSGARSGSVGNSWGRLLYGLRFAIPQTFDRQELQRIFWWGHREESINDPHFLDGLSWLFAQPCLTVEALVGGRWCKVREVDLSAPAQPRDLNDMRDIAGGWAAVAYHLRDHEGWRNDKIATELKRVPDSVTSRVSQLVHDGKRASKRRAGVCKLCTAKELTDSG